ASARRPARGTPQRRVHAAVPRRADRGRAPLGARPSAGLLVSRAGVAPGGGRQQLLDVAIEAARMAGGLLLERAAPGGEREGASKSTPPALVSEADLASERAIRELLGRRRPDDGFVGEEGSGERRGSSGLRWVVDPLDGTVNYLFGIPQWSVSVAARDEEGTVAGAVYDPNRDELFAATRGGPALLHSA